MRATRDEDRARAQGIARRRCLARRPRALRPSANVKAWGYNIAAGTSQLSSSLRVVAKPCKSLKEESRSMKRSGQPAKYRGRHLGRLRKAKVCYSPVQVGNGKQLFVSRLVGTIQLGDSPIGRGDAQSLIQPTKRAEPIFAVKRIASNLPAPQRRIRCHGAVTPQKGELVEQPVGRQLIDPLHQTHVALVPAMPRQFLLVPDG